MKKEREEEEEEVGGGGEGGERLRPGVVAGLEGFRMCTHTNGCVGGTST